MERDFYLQLEDAFLNLNGLHSTALFSIMRIKLKFLILKFGSKSQVVKK